MSDGKDEMHVLRNPHGFSEDVQRAARLWAAEEIERLTSSLIALRASVTTPQRRRTLRGAVWRGISVDCHRARRV